MRYLLAALCFAMGALVTYGILDDDEPALVAGIIVAVLAIAVDMANERRKPNAH